MAKANNPNLRVLGNTSKKGLTYLFKTNSILCARSGSKVTLTKDGAQITTDVLGIDKLYSGTINGRVVISSRISDFKSNLLNPDWEKFSMKKGYVPYPFTIFEGVRKCPPGITTTISVSGTGANKSISYTYSSSKELEVFSIPNANKKGVNTAQFRSAFERALHENYKSSLISSFSGGFDSLLLTSIYKKECSKLIHFNTSDHEPKIPLPPGITPNALEVINSDLTFSHQDIKKYFSGVDEPSCDKAGFAEYLIAKSASKDKSPLMNGQGADKIFCNGKIYLREWIANKAKYPAKKIQPTNAINLRIYRYGAPLKKRFIEEYAPTAVTPCECLEEISALHDLYVSAIKNDSVNLLGALGLMLEASQHGIAKIRAASNASSKKYYLPFLSENIIRLAFSVPGHQKVGFKIGKKILLKSFPEIHAIGYSSGAFIPSKIINALSQARPYEEYFFDEWKKSKKIKK